MCPSDPRKGVRPPASLPCPRRAAAVLLVLLSPAHPHPSPPRAAPARCPTARARGGRWGSQTTLSCACWRQQRRPCSSTRRRRMRCCGRSRAWQVGMGTGSAGGTGRHPHLRMFSLRSSLGTLPARGPAPAAPEAHRILDFWLLLVMLTLGSDRRKVAEALLRWVAMLEAHSALLRHQLRGHAAAAAAGSFGGRVCNSAAPCPGPAAGASL